MTSAQHSVGSPFNAASTAAEVMRGIDLTAKVAIVTGGYSGLGLETVRLFRQAGARVIVPARDVALATTQLAGIEGVEIELMDLLNPASVDAFAERFLALNVPLDILVNSAGIMAVPDLTLDPRGFEVKFATNHLGHFQLTGRLWPALVRGKHSRVVSVSSLGHTFSPVIFDDPNFQQRRYEPWSGYGQSKTANVLFAVELDRRGEAAGVHAFAVHPGAVWGTGLYEHMSEDAIRAAGMTDADGKPIREADKGLKTIEQGAATQVWCAVSAQLDGLGGVYCENVEIAEVVAAEDGFNINDITNQKGIQAYAFRCRSLEADPENGNPPSPSGQAR
jgi:NAD(P)-dependent dehydrogenase (short-subunit alcohol dehydrogenase family)